jgi:hypothetical protein
MTLNTGASAPLELAMTLRTSAVAVCLLQRFARLLEQPRVLDSFHGLRGKIGYERDLIICEWLHF